MYNFEKENCKHVWYRWNCKVQWCKPQFSRQQLYSEFLWLDWLRSGSLRRRMRIMLFTGSELGKGQQNSTLLSVRIRQCLLIQLQFYINTREALYLMLCGVRKMNCRYRWLAATLSIISIDIRRFTMSWERHTHTHTLEWLAAHSSSWLQSHDSHQ